jgi:hypothetical protein
MASYLIPLQAEDLRESIDSLSNFDKNELARMCEFVLRESKRKEEVYHSFQEQLRKDDFAPLKPLSKYIDFSIINTPVAADEFFKEVWGSQNSNGTA